MEIFVKESNMKIKLFYSYCHKNQSYRDKIEESLSLLKDEGELIEWHDRCIISGESISKNIKDHLDTSHIYLFLFSHHFFSSEPCKNEWKYIKEIADKRHIYRLPIILNQCPWKDFLKNDNIKVLPTDGVPIQNYNNPDEAYHQIYNSIKQVIENYKNFFSPRKDFLKEIEKSTFLSQNEINIKDIFVFPLLELSIDNDITDTYLEIKNEKDLLLNEFSLLHGEEISGKTTLCKYLFLQLIKEESPVLFIDLEEIGNKKPKEEIFRKIYEQQFEGDYDRWKKQEKKATLIFDNLSNSNNSIEHIKLAKILFDRIIVSVISDEFQAFFRDDQRLAQFVVIRIKELSWVKLEELIKKHLLLRDRNVTDEEIDHTEDKVSQVINNNIVPKYPFIILSILQTFEAYMPNNLEISSYGHCYKVLITAHLIKSGIEHSDPELNACFNFLENYAFYIFHTNDNSVSKFKEEYIKDYVIKTGTIKRLTESIYPIIIDDKFKNKYMYYYFLGSYLARNKDKEKNRINEIVEKNYLKKNNLILLFILHHTQDLKLIKDIISYSMCAFNDKNEATLDIKETKFILGIIKELSDHQSISQHSVTEERRKEREKKDLIDSKFQETGENEEDSGIKTVNDVYRILKNNEVFAQILRNHYGNLNKKIIKEIIKTIIASGLRLVKILLDEQELIELAQFIHARNPDADINKIQKLCQFLCFLWTMQNIEKVTHSISSKEIRELIKEIVDDNPIPAYEIIQYFSMLDTIEKFSEKERNIFSNLYKKHKNNIFVQKVLSLRTRFYFRTHDVDYNLKQSFYTEIGIKYKPNTW